MAKRTAATGGRPAPDRASTAPEQLATPGAPAWMGWVPGAAVVWALAYGLVRTWWAVKGAPSFRPLGTDLVVFNGWASVGLCLAAAGMALAVRSASWRRTLLVAAWALAAAFLVASALLMLDVVGALFPGLGVPFYPLAFVSRAACLLEGILLAAAAEAYRRRWRSACQFCGRTGARMGPRPVEPPRWARWGAYVAVAGWLARLVSQLAVGFGNSLVPTSGGSLLAFEAGFVLAGTVLPLALVGSWGRVVPRWVPLLAGRMVPRWLLLVPAFAIAVGMTAYFGMSIVKIAADTMSGTWDRSAGALPLAFFWVAVPAYLAWGLGLGAAALGYYRVTRRACRVCGR